VLSARVGSKLNAEALEVVKSEKESGRREFPIWEERKKKFDHFH
jgi:hypothetical protein